MQNQQKETIQNPKTTMPKTPLMNDRDFCNDVLMTEKYMTDAYSTALNEMSHQSLYEDVITLFHETQDMQRKIFETMFKKGWYKFEAEEGQKLQQTYQQFYNYTTTQFPDQPKMM